MLKQDLRSVGGHERKNQEQDYRRNSYKSISTMTCMMVESILLHVSNFEAYIYILTPQTRSLRHRAIQSINIDIDRIVIMLLNKPSDLYRTTIHQS